MNTKLREGVREVQRHVIAILRNEASFSLDADPQPYATLIGSWTTLCNQTRSTVVSLLRRQGRAFYVLNHHSSLRVPIIVVKERAEAWLQEHHPCRLPSGLTAKADRARIIWTAAISALFSKGTSRILVLVTTYGDSYSTRPLLSYDDEPVDPIARDRNCLLCPG